MLVLIYVLNIFWIPVFIRNRIELYDTFQISKDRKKQKCDCFLRKFLDRIPIITKDMDFHVSLKENDNFINQIQKKR